MQEEIVPIKIKDTQGHFYGGFYLSMIEPTFYFVK